METTWFRITNEFIYFYLFKNYEYRLVQELPQRRNIIPVKCNARLGRLMIQDVSISH